MKVFLIMYVAGYVYNYWTSPNVQTIEECGAFVRENILDEFDLDEMHNARVEFSCEIRHSDPIIGTKTLKH